MRRLRSALIDCAASLKTNELFHGFSEIELQRLLHDWPLWARDDQLPPVGEWKTWLILGGRGAGKTRAGAEWVRGLATKQWDFLSKGGSNDPLSNEPLRIALIGETFADARSVMVEGQSGLLNLHPSDERPAFEASRKRLLWKNGTEAHLFSAEDPDALRGPQFHAAWCDEIAKWRYGEETWNMLQFALRLGVKPRQVVTTTPRPSRLLKGLLEAKDSVISRSRTRDNAAFLAPGFVDYVTERYGGTRLGRQELDGELIEDRADALWTRLGLEQLRVSPTQDLEHQDLKRIVVAVDPPISSHARSDACGIVAVGLGADGLAYVLEDATMTAVQPHIWAKRAVSLWQELKADCLIVETNQGGEMVEAVIAQVNPDVLVKPVQARRSKWTRAEPVAALYAAGRVRHVGAFTELEDEMCNFGVDGLAGNRSPDRLDALVWAISELLLRDGGEPRVHFF